jgi:hypothetical protein
MKVVVNACAAVVPANSSLENALCPFGQPALFLQEALHVDFCQSDHDLIRRFYTVRFVATARHDHHASIRNAVRSSYELGTSAERLLLQVGARYAPLQIRAEVHPRRYVDIHAETEPEAGLSVGDRMD